MRGNDQEDSFSFLDLDWSSLLGNFPASMQATYGGVSWWKKPVRLNATDLETGSIQDKAMELATLMTTLSAEHTNCTNWCVLAQTLHYGSMFLG